MLQTSERDGIDSSVGCPPIDAGQSTLLRKWTSGGFSIRAISYRPPSEINSATFRCFSRGRCQSTTWPRIHAGESKSKAPRKGSHQRSCGSPNVGSFSLLATTASRSKRRRRKKAAWRKKFGSISILIPPMDMVPIITVGRFAGVRPDESARMEWEMIDFDRKHIDLPASIANDSQRRIIDMSDNLLEWLFLCRRSSGKDFAGELPEKTLGVMPGDELETGMAGRHSETLLRLLPPRQIRNAALTADQMGHKNVRMLYAHYREVVKNSGDIQ